MPLGRLFGVLVTVEAAFLVLRSAAFFVRLDTDYTPWPIVVFFLVLWPIVFAGAAYVLLFPKLPELRREAFLRAILVWIAIIANALLLAGLLTRPETIVRSPF
jgi:hypothetical protein